MLTYVLALLTVFKAAYVAVLWRTVSMIHAWVTIQM